MGLFGRDSPPDPREKVREVTRSMRHEMRALDRQIRGIQREEEKVKRSLREAAKRGDKDVCKILAKEIVQSRKVVSKLYTSKAHINSVIMSMNEQAATIRMAGSIQKSTEVMKSMQSLISVPEIAATMREMSKEMMKMGIIDEMMEETLETLEPEELEEEADAEVERVLWEITKGELGKAPDAPVGSLLPQQLEEDLAPSPVLEGEPQEDMTEMQARLEALRS